MKKLIAVLTLLTFLVSAPIALAHPAYRARIDQAWNKVQAWQKSQDRMFKKIERDATGEIKAPVREIVPHRPVWSGCPECGG